MSLPAAQPDNALAALAQEFDALIGEFAADTSSALCQARDLMRDAITRIDQSFQSIGTLHEAERRHVAAALADWTSNTTDVEGADAARSHADLDRAMDALSASSSTVQQGVNDAVRALQFEDMVRQILEQAVERVGLLSRITAEFSRQAASTDMGDCRDTLHGLCRQLAEDRARLRENRHRAVTQVNMDEGDVELF